VEDAVRRRIEVCGLIDWDSVPEDCHLYMLVFGFLLVPCFDAMDSILLVTWSLGGELAVFGKPGFCSETNSRT
jgi:hypothetical protein